MAEAGRIIALIPVRGGSKGLPGKNIRPLAGVPLYARAVAQGLRVVGRCVVSTNIASILDAPAPEGCVLLRRPDALCSDDVPMDAVINDVIEQLKLEDATKIVLLQATSPLRTDADVAAVLALHDGGAHDLVMSVTGTDSGILKYGMLEGPDYIPVAHPEYCFTNRQQLPRVFRPNGAIFVFSAGVFRRNGGLATQSIGAAEMPAARSFDIDSLADFEAAEAGLKVQLGLIAAKGAIEQL